MMSTMNVTQYIRYIFKEYSGRRLLSKRLLLAGDVPDKFQYSGSKVGAADHRNPAELSIYPIK